MAQVEVTDKAKEELVPILKEHAEKFIRLYIQGSGWGGPRLGITLDELKEDDEKVASNEIDVIFNKNDVNFIDNSVIDYEDSNMGKGFTIKTAASGGCGPENSGGCSC